ncbi:MAG: MFS transporter [bacterium]|nr:MFS transporter [bacterium]
MQSLVARRPAKVGIFVLALLVIEFLDELVFGAREAAWPLIQQDLGLTYIQIGLLFTIPNIIAAVIEPVMAIMADMGRLRALILGGGVMFTLQLFVLAASQSFPVFLLATIVLFPSSGAFVSLSQAALMKLDHTRHEQNMARWTFAGSAGVVAGPLLLSLSLAFGFGWRGAMVALGIISAVLVVIVWRVPFTFKNGSVDEDEDDDAPQTFREGVQAVFEAVRRPDVIRWVVLLECADLLMDVLLAYLALYLVNVVNIAPEQAALAVTVWTGVGLVGDLLLIPLLERVRGLDYLRISAVLEFVLYIAFLLVEPFGLKLVVLGLLGFFNAGWYSVLQAQLYSTMPGRPGTVQAADTAVSLITSFIPLGLGFIAQRAGLDVAMWLLLIGPIALMIGLPRRVSVTESA